MESLRIRQDIEEWLRFVRAEAYLLRIHPHLLFQQAANQRSESPVASSAASRLKAGRETRAHIQWVNKSQARNPCLMILVGHTDWARACAFAPDGSRAVSSSADGTLKVWDVRKGAEIRTLRGHNGTVNACTFSPDGRHIFSGGADTVLRMWDAETGAEIRTFTGHEKAILACDVSPDGRRVLSAGGREVFKDGELKLWDALTGRELRTIGRENTALANAYPSSMRSLVPPVSHEAPITACAFSPDGAHIASAGKDNSLRIWKADGTADVRTIPHRRWINDCAFSASGDLVATVADDNRVRIWSISTGAEVQAFTDQKLWRRVLEWLWRPLERFSSLWGDRSRVMACAWSPDDRLIAAPASDALNLWERESGQVLSTFAGHAAPIDECAFSPDGMQVITASRDGTLRVWDTTVSSRGSLAGRHSSAVEGCVVSPDGRTVITKGGEFKVWSADTGRQLRRRVKRAPGLKACAYSRDDARIMVGDSGQHRLAPDGRRVVAGRERSVVVIDCAAGAELMRSRDLRNPGYYSSSENVRSCDFSPDGRAVVSVSRFGVMLWDAHDGRHLKTIDETGATTCAFSGDGRTVAADNRLIDIRSGKRIILPADGDSIAAQVFFGGGAWLVTAMDDGALVVWDCQDGRELTRFSTLVPLTALAAAGPGSTIVAGSKSGGVYLLRVLNLPARTPFLTPARRWQFGPLRWVDYLRKTQRLGRWDETITSVCDWCGTSFGVPEDTLVRIAEIASLPRHPQSGAPCLDLPDEAWEDPRLVSACPSCSGQVRFNPFVVDLRASGLQ